jgi:ABC-type nitrate/sulfonate/bicarbonate transport system permease component
VCTYGQLHRRARRLVELLLQILRNTANLAMAHFVLWFSISAAAFFVLHRRFRFLFPLSSFFIVLLNYLFRLKGGTCSSDLPS